jgi:branched-chain amino acid transport system substrate-binding protein
MKMKKPSVFTILTLVVLMSLMACGPTPAPPPTKAPPPPTEAPTPTPEPAKVERPIKVGIIDTYSGPPAVYCEDALNGFKLALEEINEEGVLGTTIEFTTRDTKFAVDTGLAMAKELVMMEEVDILVGTISSGVALAVSQYAKVEQIPLIVWISKSENITGAQGPIWLAKPEELLLPTSRTPSTGLAGMIMNTDTP